MLENETCDVVSSSLEKGLKKIRQIISGRMNESSVSTQIVYFSAESPNRQNSSEELYQSLAVC